MFTLTLTGGITDADVQFTSDDGTIAEAAPAGCGSGFDVTVNGKNQDKAETTIRVKCKCACGVAAGHACRRCV